MPTYVFIATFGGIIVLGAWRALAAGGHPIPVAAPPKIATATEAITLWLLLRAFAGGCTAMTGVEAVSNGVRAFRDPTVTYAHSTLTAIVGTLGLLLPGIACLARAYGIGAMDQTQPGYQSVLSRLAGAAVGRSWVYFVAIGSLLAILSLSANTSFVGFPRLWRLVAGDTYLPRAFAIPGARLVYSVGILWLAAAAGALLAAFGGITDRLIPLFAPSCPSPCRSPGWQYIGCASRTATLVDGSATGRARDASDPARRPGFGGKGGRASAPMASRCRAAGAPAGLPAPHLVQLPSPFRSITAPLLKYILQIEQKYPNRPLAVVIPSLVRAHWWDHLLQTHRVQRLRKTLMRHGGPNIAVVMVPWTQEEPGRKR